jgi:large subunit ribosomal protein L21
MCDFAVARRFRFLGPKTMFAVIKTGGKQYRVSKDDVIAVEKLDGEDGATVVFDNVLLLGDKVGQPQVPDAKVVGEVLRQMRDDKKIIFKKRRRKHYRRRNGHRQYLTLVKITDMGTGISVAPAKTAAAPKAAPATETAEKPAEKKEAAKKTAAKTTAKKAPAKKAAKKTAKKTS